METRNTISPEELEKRLKRLEILCLSGDCPTCTRKHGCFPRFESLRTGKNTPDDCQNYTPTKGIYLR